MLIKIVLKKSKLLEEINIKTAPIHGISAFEPGNILFSERIREDKKIKAMPKKNNISFVFFLNSWVKKINNEPKQNS